MKAWPGIVQHYRSRLPVAASTPVVTLLEGNTPLIPAPKLAQSIGGEITLFLKYEAINPTASFKDRGMTMAMTKAKERGAEIVVCASTGNTSASAAAYAARAGLRCVVLLPAGKIALGKLAQAVMYGADILALEGSFDDALKIVRELGQLPHFEVVNSINPVRIEGQKTAAFEICDALGRVPDAHFLPVGNAGNITAYWQGFKEYFNDKAIPKLPKMCGFQAEGAAPIVLDRIVEHPETVASAIRIGNPASWRSAVDAARESGGFIDKVSDDEILQAYRLIARMEGIFVEPACATPLAGLMKAVQDGRIAAGSLVTATMTGHGLKDPDTAMSSIRAEIPTMPATVEAVRRNLGV
jgi:threonine synthase